ncbi:MAG: lasso peptide biosynthesis B2 protein [Sphingomonadales bacterium]|nr:lasso peptide biosynthesis B2 protein [Sphingomonadales bacterium]
MSLLGKVRTLAAMPAHRRRLAGEAAALMLAVRLALAALPFARIARWMGPFTAPGRAPAPTAAADPVEIAALSLAIATVAPNLPFRSDCLVQALAAHAMCRRRGLASTVHLGAAQAGVTAGETHAWTDAGGMPLTGYPLPSGMVEVSCFPG